MCRCSKWLYEGAFHKAFVLRPGCEPVAIAISQWLPCILPSCLPWLKQCETRGNKVPVEFDPGLLYHFHSLHEWYSFYLLWCWHRRSLRKARHTLGGLKNYSLQWLRALHQTLLASHLASFHHDTSIGFQNPDRIRPPFFAVIPRYLDNNTSWISTIYWQDKKVYTSQTLGQLVGLHRHF